MNDTHNRKTIRLKGYNYADEGLYFITISVKDKLCLFGKIDNNNENILYDSGKMIEYYFLQLENKFQNIKLHDYIVMPNHFHCIIEIINTQPVGADLCVCPVDANNKQNDLNTNKNNNCNIYGNNNEMIGELGQTFDKINGQTHRFAPTKPMNNKQNDLKYNDKILKQTFDSIPGQTNYIIPGQTRRSAPTREIHKSTPTNGKYIYSENSISSIVQWFKTMTTNKYIKMVNENKTKPFNKQLWQRNYYEHIIRDEKSYLNIQEYIQNNPKKWDTDVLYNSEI